MPGKAMLRLTNMINRRRRSAMRPRLLLSPHPTHSWSGSSPVLVGAGAQQHEPGTTVATLVFGIQTRWRIEALALGNLDHHAGGGRQPAVLKQGGKGRHGETAAIGRIEEGDIELARGRA